MIFRGSLPDDHCETNPMGDFFRGWRRKVGCVSLVLACAVTCLWMRSLSVADIGTFAITALGSTYSLHSQNGTTEWYILAGQPSHNFHWWFSSPIINYSHLVGAEQVHLLSNSAGKPVFVIVLAHWMIVLPLTLISTWLLLVRPRRQQSLRGSR